MASGTANKRLNSVRTLADLVERLGHVPLERIRFHPYPGTAKERDVVAAHTGLDRRLCELVDGVLVEKPLATFESWLATYLAYHLLVYQEEHNTGIVLGADGMVRLWRGLVRIPDVSFISWERLPGGEIPKEAIATVVPDLAVEVLSPSNTKQEMERKLEEYFRAGVRLVWIIDPKATTAAVYTSPTECKQVGKNGSLEGGDVLPGFSMSLRKLFARKSPKKPRT